MNKFRAVSRRDFLKSSTLAAVAAPSVITSFSLAGTDRPAPSNRINVGCIGIGGRGAGDMGSFLSFPEVQVVSVCDVIKGHREKARETVDRRYAGKGCAAVNDFREILDRKDIDAIMIATPDHWHAPIAIAACKAGIDVFTEKPESLTVCEGRAMVNAARRYGRVLSGGSQRVWEDYNWFHKMLRSGAIGEVKEAWVNVGGPSRPSHLPGEPVPEGVDWDLWLGPAPYVPFNKALLNYRPWRDYSGGGMTDWGCHGFGGAMFAMNLHETGPVEIIPPNGKDVKLLTYVFANGIRMYHGDGGRGSQLTFRGAKATIPEIGQGKRAGRRAAAPEIFIQNYRGRGGIIGDFLYCVKTREKPFRDIELGHRTATVAHLGNIAYWLGRPIKWNPDKEEIIGDEEASRWLSRPMRAPWTL